VRVSLKSVAGIDAVEVSLEKGLATVKMKPGNTVTFKQLQDAITKNGFTMKQLNVTIAGTVILENGEAQLRVLGSNDVLNLIPEDQSAPDVNVMNGKTVLVQGIVPETPKGKLPDSIRYHSIVEEQK
jgi:copper chaperone CopZ